MAAVTNNQKLGNFKKAEMPSITVLEARSLKLVSLGWKQDIEH
jgi:hypothetical protein